MALPAASLREAMAALRRGGVDLLVDAHMITDRSLRPGTYLLTPQMAGYDAVYWRCAAALRERGCPMPYAAASGARTRTGGSRRTRSGKAPSPTGAMRWL